MSIFDSLKRQAESSIKREASKAVCGAVNIAVQSVGKGKNHSETFTFSALPTNVNEFRALPEAFLDSAFKTTALTIDPADKDHWMVSVIKLVSKCFPSIIE